MSIVYSLMGIQTSLSIFQHLTINTAKNDDLHCSCLSHRNGGICEKIHNCDTRPCFPIWGPTKLWLNKFFVKIWCGVAAVSLRRHKCVACRRLPCAHTHTDTKVHRQTRTQVHRYNNHVLQSAEARLVAACPHAILGSPPIPHRVVPSLSSKSHRHASIARSRE